MKSKFNKTKIVATLGPASSSKSQIKSLIRAGVNVFRVNFSHGSHKEHLQRMNIIRQLNSELDFPVGILMDLQGPKIRIGEINGGEIKLEVGQKITITTDPIMGTDGIVSTTYELLPTDVKKGDIILIDDGNIEIRVLDKNAKNVFGQVLHGGKLKSRKGINLPDTNVSIPSLTEKDKEDLEFGLKQDVDWVALSFVRKAEDIRELRDIIVKKGKHTKIVAKIEKPEAVDNIDDIIDATDALMVARGDLGVEIPMEEVPITQKMLVRKCNLAAKPVIVATQMLESMIQNPRPTRAEASDVANAIMDGADAVMLSAETAAGMYPAQSVRSMSKIIQSVEAKFPGIFDRNYDHDTNSPTFLNDQVLAAACNLASETNAKVITGMTISGYTAFNLARYRPTSDIYIFTGSKILLTQCALIWGVRAFFYERFESTDDAIFDIQDKLKKAKLIKPGDVYVTTGSFPVASGKRTNTVRLNIAEN